MTPEEVYKSARWKRLREKILRRDGYQCKLCKRFGRAKEATEVHHIEHIEDAPEKAFDPDNLVSLCHACHNKMHPEKADVLHRAREKYRYD